MSDRDDAPLFGDEDETPLPERRVAWPPALLVVVGVSVTTLIARVALIAGLGLEVRLRGEDPTGDETAIFVLSMAVLFVHAMLLRYGLRRVAGYDVGFGWALFGAVLANVLPNLLGILGLVLSVPAQAAVLRMRSEPRASLVGR